MNSRGQMESRAPKLAIAGRVIGFLLLLICIFSWFLVDEKILATEKRNLIIYSMIVISLISFLTSYVASRQRAVPELGSRPSVEEQFAALESTPTSFNSNHTITDKFGFETVNSQTQTIIQSILGQQVEPNQSEVQSAINSLSQGEIGNYSATQASANPAPHRNATQFLSSVVLNQNETEKRTTIENIPLPNQENISTPDLSWMEDDHQFSTELSVKEIPLPKDGVKELSKTAEKQIIDTPKLPDIEDLLNQGNQISVEDFNTVEISKKDSSTPELPNLDNLF